MFVQTEITPNPNSLKFLPGKSVSLIGPIEITDISKTSNDLIRNILSINGVIGLFLSDDFLSVNKNSKTDWEDIKHIIISFINEFYSDFLNSNAWNMAESNKNLDLALEQIEKGLSLIDITNKSYPYLLDTKAEILWKLNKSQEAIKVIENAIKIDPNSEYYKAQKIKFQDSLNS